MNFDFESADRCQGVVFPNREVKCVAFGVPDLDVDVESGNAYVQQGCHQRG